jgi:peptidyl-prolyl cis-trans isomerase SurA
MNKIFKIILISSFINFLNISISFSSIKNNIIAKVGNEIITLIELENKINTTLILTNQQINQENINKIKTLSLKRLIDLKIKKSEIKKYNLNINDLAIQSHMQSISRDLSIDPSNLKKFFKSSMISYDQYKDEVETEFLWQRLISQIYSSKISVNEDQIDEEIKELQNKKEKIIELKLAELEVNYDNETKNELIKKIKDSIKEIGFSKTVIKYSISTSALNEGELGWINSKSISSKLINIIGNLKVGDISDEVVGAETITFYKMLDKKINETSTNVDIKLMRQNIISQKKNELLNLYSRSHLSKKKNNTLINLQ